MSANADPPVRTVFLIIPVDYAAGGLQRSTLALRECLESAGYSVTIYCFKLLPGGLARQHPFVRRITHERRSKLLFWLATVRAIRRHIREGRPEALIAFGTVPSILLPLASAFMKVPLTVGSERAYPPAERLQSWLERLRRISFPRLDLIVCQTSGIRDWFLGHLRVRDRQVVIIPNIVAPATRRRNAEPDGVSGPPTIICVGRLDEQKGFVFALEIFARILESRPDALLTIAGEGPLGEQLRRRADALGIAGRVNFSGRIANLEDHWAAADLFLFTSLFEGFPNALAEAMANGVAPVAFDCPTGPSELITDGVNGYLVPLGDVEAATARCIELLADSAKRRGFGERAREVAQRYSAERIGQLWLELIARKTQP
ncbi:MAG TPA: glycosyltransferase [Sphingomicrobium sp.]|nr:glycosyltransferase [Sphingomicrobium sp.]